MTGRRQNSSLSLSLTLPELKSESVDASEIWGNKTTVPKGREAAHKQKTIELCFAPGDLDECHFLRPFPFGFTLSLPPNKLGKVCWHVPVPTWALLA